MKRDKNEESAEREYEFRRMEYAFARAAHFARREHKLHGVPLVVCDKNGKVIEIPPEKIVVGPDPALNPPRRRKTSRATKSRGAKPKSAR